MIGTGGEGPKVSATHIVALYDPTNGRVVHLHQVVVFEGGKSISQEDAQREIIDKARRRGHDVDRLEVLYVGDRLPGKGGHFRVDIASKRLIPLEAPARRRR